MAEKEEKRPNARDEIAANGLASIKELAKIPSEQSHKH